MTRKRKFLPKLGITRWLLDFIFLPWTPESAIPHPPRPCPRCRSSQKIDASYLPEPDRPDVIIKNNGLGQYGAEPAVNLKKFRQILCPHIDLYL